jgi:hypothetical protein
VVELETFARLLGRLEGRRVPRRPLFDPSCAVAAMIATSSIPLTMLRTMVWYVKVACRHRSIFVAKRRKCSTRTAVVGPATYLAPLVPTLNRVPDPASQLTQPAVEVSGMWLSVVPPRRSSRNWTSPNVLPTCTLRGCTSLFFFPTSNMISKTS